MKQYTKVLHFAQRQGWVAEHTPSGIIASLPIHCAIFKLCVTNLQSVWQIAITNDSL